MDSYVLGRCAELPRFGAKQQIGRCTHNRRRRGVLRRVLLTLQKRPPLQVGGHAAVFVFYSSARFLVGLASVVKALPCQSKREFDQCTHLLRNVAGELLRNVVIFHWDCVVNFHALAGIWGIEHLASRGGLSKAETVLNLFESLRRAAVICQCRSSYKDLDLRSGTCPSLTRRKILDEL